MTGITGWDPKWDYKMLVAVSELMCLPPEHLLDDLIQKTGENIRIIDLERGQGLPSGIRNELRNLYNHHITQEIEIQENCKETSKNIIPFMFKVIVLLSILMLIISFLG